MENKEQKLKYAVVSGLCLSLENLFAEVSITAGQEEVVVIEMAGDEKLIKEIQITQPDSSQLQIKGTGSIGQGGGISVVSVGGRQSISVSNLRGGSVIVAGGGTVVVDGRTMPKGVNVIEGGDIPKIKVVVPAGTNLEVYDVEQLESVGLGGKLSCGVSGQGKLKVLDVKGLKAKASGQSHIEVGKVSGDAKLQASGQSSIQVQGEVGDVEADTGGQSSIYILGNCRNFEGEAGGQSRITLSGQASGKIRQRERGQASINVR